MTRPRTEEIRKVLADMPGETVADALAILLAEGGGSTDSVAESARPELANFAQAILYLKRNYDFEELDRFATEADLVYVSAGDRRVLLTNRNIAGQPPHETRDSPSRASDAPRVEAPKGTEREGEPFGDSGRFSHLEI